jgi:serine/threonine protein kinase
LFGTATAGRNVPLRPGQLVDDGDGVDWQVVAHIADGGFSSVYEVRPANGAAQRAYGPRHRALKCLWGTPAELTAIGGEAAKMAAVEGHENVLGLVSSFRFDGADRPQAHYVGLVLELADEDLRRFAARAVPSERAWAAVFEQVAAGLDHIHSRRVVHGDIKPTNVLRIGGRFAIADFGVAAPLETTRSAGIGLARTIAFWPPESASQGILCADGVRRPPVDGWRATQLGDVWALAVSMHRVLTGRHITPGTTPEQQYELVCLGKYSIDDRIGPGWRQLFADCLAHDPDDRLVSSAGALRLRLAELALADDYLGVPWADGRPRVVAVLDLGQRTPPTDPPPADPAPADPDRPAGPTPEPEPTLDLPVPRPEPAAPHPDGPTTALVRADGPAREALLLYLTQDGGRVHGTVMPADGLLLAAARHLAEVAVPSLAQQVRDSQRAVLRLVDEQQRLRERAGPAPARPVEDAASTLIVGAAEVERTRELTVAVADVTRQRDRLARDRDRLTRHRDELAEERDRLRQQYTDLARRMDRLERDQRHDRDQRRRGRDFDEAPTTELPWTVAPVRPTQRAPLRGGSLSRPPRPAADRPAADRSAGDRPAMDRPATDRPAVDPVFVPADFVPAKRRRRGRRLTLLIILVLCVAGGLWVAKQSQDPFSGVSQLINRIGQAVTSVTG